MKSAAAPDPRRAIVEAERARLEASLRTREARIRLDMAKAAAERLAMMDLDRTLLRWATDDKPLQELRATMRHPITGIPGFPRCQVICPPELGRPASLGIQCEQLAEPPHSRHVIGRMAWEVPFQGPILIPASHASERPGARDESPRHRPLPSDSTRLRRHPSGGA